MGTYTIYKSEKGKQELLASYEAYLEQLDIEFERVDVQTRWGRTHVLTGGLKSGRPILILQGGNCINPMTLSWFAPLSKTYRIIAPDTIGHPGYSEEIRLSAADDSFPGWIQDIMDYFEIDRCAFVGPSYGAGIILRVAAYMPERISCAVLAAPAGLVLGSKWNMIRRVLFPLVSYQITSSRTSLRAIADAMSLSSMKRIDEEMIGQVFKHVRLEQDMPKLTDKQELLGFNAPTMLIAGTEDVFFPGEAVVERAKEIIPNLASCKLYHMGHFPAQEHLEEMNEAIQSFLHQFYVS